MYTLLFFLVIRAWERTLLMRPRTPRSVDLHGTDMHRSSAGHDGRWAPAPSMMMMTMLAMLSFNETA